MKFILLTLTIVALLTTTGCISRGDRDHPGDQHHDDHPSGVEHGEYPGDMDHGQSQQ
jgi:hypothetical protein